MGEGDCPGAVRLTGGHAYRRRPPEKTLLYRAVQENLASLRDEAAELGRGLPRHVDRDFARYLECGVLAHGFARVWCGTCKDDLLVAFSCKGRGVCPSCNARRAHVTAAHLVEQVLPQVPYRQWTLSFPHRVRWVLLKDAGLLSEVLGVFLRALFALQRRRARRLGTRGGQTRAVTFTQYFGSALQLTPHFHSVVPDGVWVPLDDEVRFVLLPPPSQEEVERLVAVVRTRVLRLLERRGVLPAEGPEDAKQAYQVHSLQQRLRFAGPDVKPPPRRVPRCAYLEGFSLHANTHLHANDREGLERLCRYGARGALALERFEEGEDGAILYRMKRPMPDGATHLRFSGLKLLRRLAALVPPPRSNLVRYHGVFASGATLRPFLVPTAAAPAEGESTGGEAGEAQGARRWRTARLDWAGLQKRTVREDVLECQR
ncbi:transposase [Vitiosangium sp. GDMCC 1.1324]|uniref:transposase n=1 Tax=Vitiosangium sp. (strain GDMCC 1.1324) TaxID=2138576 RepID=UPI001E29C3BD|nr:transposase [Vitiosangium sp. GDMCC 1.1324]